MYAVTSPTSQDDTTTLVNIGASVMNVNIVEGACPCLRATYLGRNGYSEAVQREMGVSFEEAGRERKATETTIIRLRP